MWYVTCCHGDYLSFQQKGSIYPVSTKWHCNIVYIVCVILNINHMPFSIKHLLAIWRSSTYIKTGPISYWWHFIANVCNLIATKNTFQHNVIQVISNYVTDQRNFQIYGRYIVYCSAQTEIDYGNKLMLMWLLSRVHNSTLATITKLNLTMRHTLTVEKH